MIIPEIQDRLHHAMQMDLECGVAWMNDHNSKEFKEKYPNISEMISLILNLDPEDEEE